MNQRVAGVDEAGRGPLAGPVTVSAVILDPDQPIDGLADSKILSEKRREALYPEIKARALAWSIIEINTDEIDQLNILQATMTGMCRAVEALSPCPQLALIDGNRLPDLPCDGRAIVQGDRLEACISAASILAKVSRDHYMTRLHQIYPEYGFQRHKGYPTAFHLEQLERYGPCPEHRRSFAPVRRCLQTELL